MPRNVGLSQGAVRITPGLKNSATVVKAGWFIHKYHFFLRYQMKWYLRIKICKRVIKKKSNIRDCAIIIRRGGGGGGKLRNELRRGNYSLILRLPRSLAVPFAS